MHIKVNNIAKNVSAIIFSPYYKKSKVISINSKATMKVIKMLVYKLRIMSFFCSLFNHRNVNIINTTVFT